MLHRLTAVLLVWFGLALAAPALACSLAAAGGDCCPADASFPCGSDVPSYRVDAAVATCCVSATASSPAIEVADTIRQLHWQIDSSPDSLAFPAHVTPRPDAAVLSRLTQLSDSPARTDATLTYLHTGRLRL